MSHRCTAPSALAGFRDPLASLHIVNSAAGAYDVPLQRQAWCAALSIVPPALIISGLANGLLAP